MYPRCFPTGVVVFQRTGGTSIAWRVEQLELLLNLLREEKVGFYQRRCGA